MDEQQREQRGYMNARWEPPAWVSRESLTPMADYAAFSSLIFCRDRMPRDLSQHSLLIVNAGWGVDTHFFQTEGVGRITVTDISERVLKITGEHCPGVVTVAAATENLPFPDASFDFVGVRSGLHHLLDPYAGLAEMVRVARAGVFFIEGHQTPLTPVLAHLGIIHGIEEGGNPEYRFHRAEVGENLTRLGITRFSIDTRWFMQLPPLLRISRSIPGRFPALALRAFVYAFNLVFAPIGNAMVVVATKK